MNEKTTRDHMKINEIYQVINDNLKYIQYCNLNFKIIAQSMLISQFQNFNFKALDLIDYLQENFNKNIFNKSNFIQNDSKSTNSNNCIRKVIPNKIRDTQSNVNGFINHPIAGNSLNKQIDNIQNINVNYINYSNDNNVSAAKNVPKNIPINNSQQTDSINNQDGQNVPQNEKNSLNRHQALKEKFFHLKCIYILISKYLAKNNKKYFQVVYMFKNK